MLTRAIMVHSLDDARTAAEAAAALGVPLTLVSAPGAAAYLGPGWFPAVKAILAQTHPDLEIAEVLDCGDKAGQAMAALRAGVPRLRFTGRKAVAAKLAEIAAAQGGEVVTGQLRALDLLDLPDPSAACRRWLTAP